MKLNYIFSITLLLTILFTIAPSTQTNAGFFSNVKDAVTGHVKDIKSRFDKDRPGLEYNSDNIIKAGKIDEDAIGQDPLHRSEGTVSIVNVDNKNYLVLSKDFDSSTGPDYHVYLSKDAKIVDESGFKQDRQIEISRLNYGNGFQFYQIPDDIDVNQINSFLLWCKKFGAYIGSADLKSEK